MSPEQLGLGQTNATFCHNIVQHCWHLLRLVTFLSDETGQRTQQLNATWYAADHMCYYNDYYVLSLKSVIFLRVRGLICACSTATMLFSGGQTIVTCEIVTKCWAFVASKFD